MKERLLLFIVITVFASFGAWIGVMAVDSDPPYSYDAENSRIVPDPAPQGAMVTADWALTKVNRVCPASVQRFFRDAETQKMVSTLDTTEASRAVRVGDNNLPRSFQLPPNLPAKVEYSALVCFECNIFQRIVKPLCLTTPKITFNVIQ